MLDDAVDRLLDPALDAHRVRAGRHVAKAFLHHRLGEHRRGGRSVTGDVVGLLGDFLHELGADLLGRVLELDLLGDRHTIVGDRRCAPLLLDHDVAALRAQRDLHRVGELVHPRLERAASFLIEDDELCSHPPLPILGLTCRLYGRRSSIGSRPGTLIPESASTLIGRVLTLFIRPPRRGAQVRPRPPTAGGWPPWPRRPPGRASPRSACP